MKKTSVLLFLFLLLLCFCKSPIKTEQELFLEYIRINKSIKTIKNLKICNYKKDTIRRLVHIEKNSIVYKERIVTKAIDLKWLYIIFEDPKTISYHIDMTSKADTNFLKYCSSNNVIIGQDTIVLRKYLEYKKNIDGTLMVYWTQKYGVILISSLQNYYMLYNFGNTMDNYKIHRMVDGIIIQDLQTNLKSLVTM